MNRGFVLGRYRGVAVVLDTSMLLLTLLLVVSLYADLVSRLNGGGAVTVILAGLGGVLFLGGVILHEVSHTALALRRGLQVARIRLFIFGGVSEIQSEAKTANDEFAISVVGPVTSVALGGGLVLLGVLVPDSWRELSRVLVVSGWAHLALGVFNILPGFPLDGGRALRALLWRSRGDKDSATSTALLVGKRFGLVVIGVGAWLAIRGLVGAGMWVALIGWFVNRTAVAAEHRENFLERVRGHTIGDVMRPITETVRQDLTIDRLIDLYTVGPRLATQAVEVDGRIIGLIGATEIDDIDDDRRGVTSVAEVMVRIGPSDVVPATADLVEVLDRESSPSFWIVVTSGARAVGVVTGDEFKRFLRDA